LKPEVNFQFSASTKKKNEINDYKMLELKNASLSKTVDEVSKQLSISQNKLNIIERSLKHNYESIIKEKVDEINDLKKKLTENLLVNENLKESIEKIANEN